MRLGLNLRHWRIDEEVDNLALAQEADRLGYAVVWNAEAYGSDAPTTLAWLAAQTSRIDVGSAVMQIPARTPAMTAMTAATLDMLSGGRFRLGLGVSGPQVSEGWHGVRFSKPLTRTREYVDIVRMALDGKPVCYDGQTYHVPLPDGAGKALRLSLHPGRAHIPIYLAAIGPKNLELAGEVADGWLAAFFAPRFACEHLDRIATGRARVGKTVDGFDIVATTPLVVGDDIDACADLVREYAALYVGGMGSREQNFYNNLAVRMGYPDQAARIQDLYLARDYAGAAAAVPLGFADSIALLGPSGRLAHRMAEFAAAGVTTLAISPFAATHTERLAALQTAAEALEHAGVGG